MAKAKADLTKVINKLVSVFGEENVEVNDTYIVVTDGVNNTDIKIITFEGELNGFCVAGCNTVIQPATIARYAKHNLENERCTYPVVDEQPTAEQLIKASMESGIIKVEETRVEEEVQPEVAETETETETEETVEVEGIESVEAPQEEVTNENQPEENTEMAGNVNVVQLTPPFQLVEPDGSITTFLNDGHWAIDVGADFDPEIAIDVDSGVSAELIQRLQIVDCVVDRPNIDECLEEAFSINQLAHCLEEIESNGMDLTQLTVPEVVTQAMHVKSLFEESDTLFYDDLHSDDEVMRQIAQRHYERLKAFIDKWRTK